MKRVIVASFAWLAAAGTSAAAVVPIEPNYGNVDTGRWRCRLCPFELALPAQWTGTLGAIHVDDASARFGRDSGLDEAGMASNLDIQYRRRTEDGRARELDARRLGLDSRLASLRVHGAGSRLLVERRGIPRNIATDGRSPFVGDASLTLPGDWMAALDTAAMSGLMQAGRFDEGTRRRRTTVGVRIDPRPDWWLKADYSRETKSGSGKTFADLFHRSTALPKPVDFLNEEITTGTGLERDSFLLAAELRHARFRNANRALVWQNPWPGPPLAGRKGLAPDNRARSFTLVSRAAHGNRATLHGTLTWSEATQDDVLLPYTANARLLRGVALPANSLDGRVRSFAGTFHLVGRLGDRLRMSVGHRERRRDDATAALTLRPVDGDLFRTGRAVSSRRIDLRRSTTELGVDYRLAPRLRLGAYTEANRIERVPAEIAANAERRHRIELSARGWRGLRAKLTLAHVDRDASEFHDLTHNNPLTRRYHQAAREQRVFRIRVGYEIPDSDAFVEIHAECRSNAYPESVLGLQHDRTCARGGDVTYAASDNVTLGAFYLAQKSDSATAGRVGHTGPGWRYALVDGVATAGLHWDLGGLGGFGDGRLGFSVDYVRSSGTGRTVTEWDGAPSAFPDLISSHSSIDVHARYALRAGRTLVVQLRHERFRGEDWALGDALDAIGNVVTFGNTAPRYAANRIGVAYEASF